MIINRDSRLATWLSDLQVAKAFMTRSGDLEFYYRDHGPKSIDIIDQVGYKPYNSCQVIRRGFIFPLINISLILAFIATSIVAVYITVKNIIAIFFLLGGFASVLPVVTFFFLVFVFIKIFTTLKNKKVFTPISNGLSKMHGTICTDVKYVKDAT